MIAMITVLLAKGNAYQAGGEVLFDVASMKDYGALSNRKLEEQQAGARVAVEAHKKNPGDFVLWKLSSAEEPGWESPWGRGRPGWHIECSAMSKSYLGEVFDIHGGGLDLIFPHHENEIAQSRCAHGTDVMANIWMHNGFLQVEGQKMSKSLGNFVTINELLETNKFGGRVWDGAVLRFTMLKTHYRQPIDWTSDSLRESEQTLDEWSALVLGASELSTLESAEGLDPRLPSAITDEVATLLGDDLNLNDTMVRLHQIAKQAKSQSTPASFQDARHNLWSACNFLGIDLDGYRSRMTSVVNKLAAAHDTKKIKELITARLAARAAKDWKESDRIRDELDAMGVTIKDNKDGTMSWEVKR
jgi:cysteinyl-tRNA synthetase